MQLMCNLYATQINRLQVFSLHTSFSGWVVCWVGGLVAAEIRIKLIFHLDVEVKVEHSNTPLPPHSFLSSLGIEHKLLVNQYKPH